MISSKQYRRLTVVAVIPLLLLGWWLAENEKILPLHNLIYCQESDSAITCNSISATKKEANSALYQNAAVRLWGAKLEGGFNHSVITLGHSEIKVVNGETATVPPTDGGIKKLLILPPRSIQGNMFASCEISPYANSDKNWGYSCIGGDLVPDSFYFFDESTSQKFLKAKLLIEEQKKKDEAMSIRGLIFTMSTPLIGYLVISIALFLLSRIVRYVVHGREKQAS